MKFRFAAIAFLLPAFAMAQTSNFSITGQIGKIGQPAKVYIDYSDNGKNHEDSCVVVDGKFTFKGNVSGVTTSRMSFDHQGKGKPHSIYAPNADVVYIYFGKENVSFISKDSLANAQVLGSKIYNEFQAYNAQIGGTIMALTKAVNQEFQSASPEMQKDTTFQKAVDARFLRNIKRREEKQFEFAKANPNSYFALVALSESAGTKVDVARVEPVYKALNADLRNTDMGKELAMRITATTITAVGQQAPQFTQNDVNGKPLSLASLKGKYVLVEFWASWCGPCRAGNPNLVEQYKLYKDKGFEILSVSLDNNKQAWVDAIKKDGLPWLHVSDLKYWNNDVARLYGVRAVPASFLLDKDGKVIGNTLRDESLNAKLAEIFKN
ncbi:TlpA disulfide reductase family protein [Mucilaginibacter myungsuensis]|uniref:AhpC/TSA family protein n=1 Tax=Mucilaginibacter myungsuensis TaxID=649104 RepID=A0A929PUI5_9SPHI|nr:TlpA disulfide reductase family protein [Mucilaginibacter myungsuensis]MBE9660798.1 AhpC/TSA family protein [Mucilaginibacter myungsuensis]MDN3600844.1 TlpA disulfide reductase family protein [Mucilaginibacter myungsuensis]